MPENLLKAYTMIKPAWKTQNDPKLSDDEAK